MHQPDPIYEPYFRQYLGHPTASRGAANVLAAVVTGQYELDMMQDAMLFVLASPLTYFLVWGQDSFGDDGKACIDVGLRALLHSKYERYSKSREFQHKEHPAKDMIMNLIGNLKTPSDMGPMRERLDASLASCRICLKEADLTCSRCKAVRYCSAEHQLLHWNYVGEEGLDKHKYSCFPTPFDV